MPSLGGMTIYSIARMKLSLISAVLYLNGSEKQGPQANIKLLPTFLTKADFTITILNDV
jgi:hypothetical protein